MKNLDLKLFTTYSPPEHQDGIVRKTKAEANDPTKAESFDGNDKLFKPEKYILQKT